MAAIEPIRSAETTEESYIGEAILEAGRLLVNLHMADSNRGALGLGSLDLISSHPRPWVRAKTRTPR